VGEGKRLVVLAHIEDIVSGYNDAPAKQSLIRAGISNEDLELIKCETRHLLESYKTKGQTLLYPEEVFQRVQYKMEFATVGELNKNIAYTNSEYLRHLLELVEAASKGNDTPEKRRTLENLAQYLFSSVEGLYVEPSTKTVPTS